MVRPKKYTNKSSRDNNVRDASLHIFHRNPVTWKLDVGMHLICYYPYCLYTFWTYTIPTYFFNLFSCFLYLFYINKYEILPNFNMALAKVDHQIIQFSGCTIYCDTMSLRLRVIVCPCMGIAHSQQWSIPRKTTNENGASSFIKMASPLTVKNVNLAAWTSGQCWNWFRFEYHLSGTN